MKKIFFIFLSSALIFSCSGDKDGKLDGSIVNVNANGDGTTNGSLPVIKFSELEHDFGKITQGEKVKWAFNFTNEGKGQLVVSNVATTCGCTIVDYPKDPIAPGKGGKIDVVFNSEDREAEIIRKITVVTNCEPNATTLSIKSFVVIPESKYSNETK